MTKNNRHIGAVFALAVAAMLPESGVAHAQSTSSSAPALVSGPITQVIAIGTIQNVSNAGEIRGVMNDEVRDTVRLYLDGKIAQWYVRRDTNGVVFLLNATSAKEAATMLAALPLVKEKLMRFDFIPVGPLSPLGLLIQSEKAVRP